MGARPCIIMRPPVVSPQHSNHTAPERTGELIGLRSDAACGRSLDVLDLVYGTCRTCAAQHSDHALPWFLNFKVKYPPFLVDRRAESRCSLFMEKVTKAERRFEQSR
jgi:hypothetical protein